MHMGSPATVMHMGSPATVGPTTIARMGSPATIANIGSATHENGNGATEMSGIGIFGSAYANVTLEALAQYSAELLASGALDSVGTA
jgi:hypothetical protein